MITRRRLNSTRGALKIHTEFDDKVGMSADYFNIGRVYSALGDYKKARDFHKRARLSSTRALKIHTEFNDKVRSE